MNTNTNFWRLATLLALLTSGLNAEILIQKVIRKPDEQFIMPVSSSFERGFRFSLSVPALVTHLSLFDVDQDGLPGSYRVTLWDNSGNVLARTAVGNSDPFDASGQFRTHPLITPVMISANTTYVLSANYNDVDAPGELLASAVEGGAISTFASIFAHGIPGPSPLEANNAVLSSGVADPDPVFPTVERTFSNGGSVSLQFTPNPKPVCINEISYDPVTEESTIEFHTTLTISYRIESSTNLIDWTPITTTLAASADTNQTVTNLAGIAGETYYRVGYLLTTGP